MWGSPWGQGTVQAPELMLEESLEEVSTRARGRGEEGNEPELSTYYVLSTLLGALC